MMNPAIIRPTSVLPQAGTGGLLRSTLATAATSLGLSISSLGAIQEISGETLDRFAPTFFLRVPNTADLSTFPAPKFGSTDATCELEGLAVFGTPFPVHFDRDAELFANNNDLNQAVFRAIGFVRELFEDLNSIRVTLDSLPQDESSCLLLEVLLGGEVRSTSAARLAFAKDMVSLGSAAEKISIICDFR